MSRDQHVASKFSWIFRNDIPSIQHALGLYLIIRMFFLFQNPGRVFFFLDLVDLLLNCSRSHMHRNHNPVKPQVLRVVF
jgi:hypothetical protein